MRDRSDTVSADGLFQVNKGLELYGRFATRFNGNGDNTNIYASALTYSGQLRAQQRLNNYLDLAPKAVGWRSRHRAPPNFMGAAKSDTGYI